MSKLSVIVAMHARCAVPAGGRPLHWAGPGDDDDDETPIGDPPDDDGDDDWDDDDDDDDDDEEPLQAGDIAPQHRHARAVAAQWRPDGTRDVIERVQTTAGPPSTTGAWLNSDC